MSPLPPEVTSPQASKGQLSKRGATNARSGLSEFFFFFCSLLRFLAGKIRNKTKN